MGDRQQWWNEFWKKQTFDLPIDGNAGETWYDLVWKVNFEFWHDLFDRMAPGKNMLECGCGRARVSQFMTYKGYKCTLLDYSENALELGRKGFNSQNLDGRFVIGDINHLCFPDECFDIIFSGGVLEFFDDIRQPVDEMVRVLKPGGIFAANMVPRKFSIQTIADFERSLAYSCRNLVKGRFGEVLKRVLSVPPNYGVNSLRLKDYINVCRQAQLEPVVGMVASPFPELALPQTGKRLYGRILQRLLPLWRKFNLSTNRWTEIWGITYTLYGVKK